MDSSIPQVTLKGSTSDQSDGQGLSSVKKKGKGNADPAGLIALIGGPGSFANLLSKKGDGKKEDAASSQVASIAGNDEIGKASIGSINGGRESFFLKVAMGHMGMGTIALAGEISSEKNAKTSSGIPSTGEMSEAKTKGKWHPGMSGKPQILKGDEITGEDDAANLQKGTHSEGGKKAADGMRGILFDEMEDQKSRHDRDLSKGSDVKGSSISKVSPDPKGSGMLSIKDGAQYSADIVKDNMTSILQIKTEGEKIENYKNLSIEGLKSERSLQNAANDIQTAKSGLLPSGAQTDFSMVNGVWSDVRTSVTDKIAAPVSFQAVAGQIIDGASNMLMKGSSRIVITLEPPNLGTLNLDVRVQHDTVRMVLIADNHEVKQVLQANLDQLKTALQGQGLNIDRFEVLVPERSYDGNQGFQPGGGALFEGGQGSREDTKDTKDDRPLPQMLPAGGNEINEPSLGIISLFV